LLKFCFKSINITHCILFCFTRLEWKQFISETLVMQNCAILANSVAELWHGTWEDIVISNFSLKCWSMIPKLFSDPKLKYWLSLLILNPKSLIPIPWFVIPILWSQISHTMSQACYWFLLSNEYCSVQFCTTKVSQINYSHFIVLWILFVFK